jgi:DNA-binding transcriptional MerR regulator
MLNIGDFARHGRVSVRMLRHYDAIGLLRPAHVDPASGYRFYQAGQLARLNRIIALKDLGFTLEQVSGILDGGVSSEQLRGMLRLRRAELEASIAADAVRLAGVEVRLRTIEDEGTMPNNDVVIKHLPAVRLAVLTASAAGFEPESITPVIRPLYESLGERLGEAGIEPTGMPIAYYERAEDDTVIVHAGLPVSVEPSDRYDFAVVDLPATEAATIVHRGSMAECLPSYQALATWVDAHGYTSVGPAREFYLDCPDDESKWATELQEPVTGG